MLKALDEAHAHLPTTTTPTQAAAAQSDSDASTEEAAPQLEVCDHGLMCIDSSHYIGATRD